MQVKVDALGYPRPSFLYGTFLFLVFGQKHLDTNFLSIFKPPKPLQIDNIQAQISGLSFGVARELFSDFRFSGFELVYYKSARVLVA